MTLSRWRWPLLLVVMIVAMAVSMWPKSSAPLTSQQRIDRLASEIRCPTCQGLSVAESESPLARSTHDEIARRVTDGQTDHQIKDFMVSRYGPNALMTPARHGITLIAWVLPVVVVVLAAGGAGLAVRRWQQRGGLLFASADDYQIVQRSLASHQEPEPSQP